MLFVPILCSASLYAIMRRDFYHCWIFYAAKEVLYGSLYQFFMSYFKFEIEFIFHCMMILI